MKRLLSLIIVLCAIFSSVFITNNNTKALQELVALSNTNYPAVASGLSNAIRQAPKVVMFYYIRAVIAESHHKYLAAISDYKKIIYENLYNYSGIYNSIAKCYYSLGNYVEALDNVDYALSASKKNKEYFLTKAKILRALKNSIAAIECCNSALAIDANHNDALIKKSDAPVKYKDISEFVERVEARKIEKETALEEAKRIVEEYESAKA